MIAGAASRPAGQAADTVNNFDALRLIFAATVALYHFAVLAALPALAPLVPFLAPAGELAVQGFFVLSGYLVYGSWDRTRDLRRYAGKRFRRLYPAYAAVVIVMALVALAGFVHDAGALAQVGRYLGANLVFANFLAPTLPGLFADNPHAAVNGALWTIKIEVCFYLIVPILFWLMARLPRAALIAALYVGAALWRAAFAAMEGEWPLAAEMGRQLPGQMGFFICGAALWIWRDGARDRLHLIGAAGALLFLSSFAPMPGLAADLLRPAGWAGLIFWAAHALPRLYDASRYGDYSYGLYLTHFPIIQLIVMTGLFGLSPLLASALCVIAMAAATLALWTLVERPSLARSSHYRGGAAR